MTGKQLSLLGGPFGAGAQGDPNWQNVTLLSGTTTTNAGQNNTFLDSSSNNFTITRNGNTTQGTFSPFSQADGYWSNYFDGSGDYLTYPYSSGTNISGNFTIEFWVYTANNNITYQGILQYRNDTAWNTGDFQINMHPDNRVKFDAPSGASVFTNALGLNQWNHVAFVRSGSTITSYLNGVSCNTTSDSTTFTGNNGVRRIGEIYDGTHYYWTGYISNVRIVTGAAVYTGSTYTVPTSALGVYGSGTTILLTCQSNRFVDNATTPSTLTVNGNPAVLPFQPFGAPITAYSASTVGGSGYFDGNGDYLSIANNTAIDVGTGVFTYECWFYPTDGKNNFLMAANGTGAGFHLAVYGSTTTNLYVSLGRNNVAEDLTTSAGTVIYSAWNHIVAVRNSSNNLGIFINGTRQAYNSSNTNNYGLGGFALTLGTGENNNSTVWMQGYQAGAGVYKSAEYDPTQTSITVPTSPKTGTGAGFLCNFTNANIYDQAAKNDMETVGNAQVSTSVKKFGDSSAYFDGNGDYLVSNYGATDLSALGSGEFTVEMWLYFNSVSGDQVILDWRDASTTAAYPLLVLSSSTILWSHTNVTRITSAAVSASQWYHLVVSRSGGSTKMYLNGNQTGSTYADTTNYLTTTGAPRVAIDRRAGSNYFNGYISDLRITKGLGRYPYNFTPPTTSLPNFYQAQTLTADPYFDYTTLLLPGSGTNGAQNNTFLDSSTNAFSITRNGNTTQGTFSPFSQANGYWSNYFDGTGDYLDFPDNAAFRPGTGDFTIEGWFYSTSSSNTSTIKLLGTTTGYQTGGFAILRSAFGADGNFDFIIEPSDVAANVIRLGTFGSSLLNNTWYHFAVARSGTTLSAWVNGVRTDTDTNSTNIDDSGGDALRIGGNRENTSNLWQGYISNIKYNKGTAYYDPTQTTITVPTSPLTNTSGTDLLTCQSNRFVDNSSNAFAATPAGDISVQQFVPFNPTAAYSASTNGGSGYFDGNGDYLVTPVSTNLQLGSSDFTIEFWTYATSSSANNPLQMSDGGDTYSALFGNRSGSNLLIYLSSNGSSWNIASGQSWGAISPGEWVHRAVTRSGDTFYAFRNGVQTSTWSAPSAGASVYQATNQASIGQAQGSPGSGWIGHLADFRIIKGTAQYTADFTPPTAPLTAITNTQLLLNFTNAGITDATAKNDLETVADAQISNTTAKWGSTSIKFDGTGDRLQMPDSPGLRLGTGDFTIEGWFYTTTLSGQRMIFYKSQSDTTGVAFLINNGGAGSLDLYAGAGSWAVTLSGANAIAVNTWTHLAGVRYGDSWMIFSNGNLLGTQTSNVSASNTTEPATIGYFRSANPFEWNGYMQDVRITKGIARYTQNFTPPTAAFQLL